MNGRHQVKADVDRIHRKVKNGRGDLTNIKDLFMKIIIGYGMYIEEKKDNITEKIRECDQKKNTLCHSCRRIQLSKTFEIR